MTWISIVVTAVSPKPRILCKIIQPFLDLWHMANVWFSSFFLFFGLEFWKMMKKPEGNFILFGYCGGMFAGRWAWELKQRKGWNVVSEFSHCFSRDVYLLVEEKCRVRCLSFFLFLLGFCIIYIMHEMLPMHNAVFLYINKYGFKKKSVLNYQKWAIIVTMQWWFSHPRKEAEEKRRN